MLRVPSFIFRCLMIFQGKCLYYREWNRPVHTLSDDPEEDKRLMFGMLFSIKDLVNKVSCTSKREQKLGVYVTSCAIVHLSAYLFCWASYHLALRQTDCTR